MNTPDLNRPFSRTNRQTIQQRVTLLKELHPSVSSIAEICCGDCQSQYETYRSELNIQRFLGLDISPEVVALNCSRGIPCVGGDALDGAVLRSFLDFDVVFFGPPLSEGCEGHRLIPFQEVVPGYEPFANLLLHDLNYRGLLILIGPRTTNMGDANWIDHKIRAARPDYHLRLMHYSYSSITGQGEPTELRLKYVELWYQVGQTTQWEIRESKE